MNLFSRHALVLLGVVAGSLLAGCSSSDDPPPPATLTAKADASTVSWNMPGTIDVLANDVVSHGAKLLKTVTGALHGTTAVVDGKIVYTPAAGFYGTEKLTYTAIAVDGGATAQGEAVVTVEAVMTLNGNASDAPLASATVTAAVGAKNFTATSNAAGNFSVVIRSAAPTDFVVLTAVGSGTQTPVKLGSLVGDIGTLLKSADAQGQVGMMAVPALAVSHYTSAFMALATQALGGTAPGTAQQLRDASAQIVAADVLYLATAIRLVADKGVPLPAGTGDTLALVKSPSAVLAVYAAAATLDPLLADATRAAVDQELNAGSPFTMAGMSERTVVYGTLGNLTVTYRADGTGRTSGLSGEHDIKWVVDGTTVRLKYDKPIEWIYEKLMIGGVSNPYTIVERTDGIIIVMVLNDTLFKIAETGTVTWVDGPNAGAAVLGHRLSTTNTPADMDTAYYPERRLPIDAAMTAPGMTLFGAISTPRPLVNTGSTNLEYLLRLTSDALQFTSATEARFLVSQAVVSWKVQDNWLSITHADGNVWRFALLANSNVTGKQAWMAEYEVMKVKAGFNGFIPAAPKLKFTEALALRKWQLATSRSLSGQPNADGTVTSAAFPSSTHTNTWEITADGDLIIKHVLTSTGAVRRVIRYIPIRMIDDQLWFFAHQNNGRTSSTYINFVAPLPAL